MSGLELNMSELDDLENALETLSVAPPQTKYLLLSDIGIEPQVRSQMDAQKLAEMVEDIKQRGLLQPIKVRQTPGCEKPYVVLYGHRRFMAHERLGEKSILAIIDSEINGEDILEIAALQFSENKQREDLPLVDEIALVQLFKSHNVSGKDIAKRLNVTNKWVSVRDGIGRAGEATAALIASGVTEDVEAIYQFSKLEKSEPKKASSLLDSWTLEGGDVENLRGQISEAMEVTTKPPKVQPPTSPGGEEEEGGEAPEPKAKKPKNSPETGQGEEQDSIYRPVSVRIDGDTVMIVTDKEPIVFESVLIDMVLAAKEQSG